MSASAPFVACARAKGEVMSQIFTLPEDELRGEIYERIYLLVTRKGGGWQSAGAAFGLAAGALSVPTAAALWAAAKFFGPAGIGPALNFSSTILFVLTLPLLALGACFLDRLEKKSPSLPLPAPPEPAAPERRQRIRPQRPHLN